MDEEPEIEGEFIGVSVHLDPDQFLRWQCMMVATQYTDDHHAAIAMANEWADFLESAPAVTFHLDEMIQL